jgi:hypothetical protein
MKSIQQILQQLSIQMLTLSASSGLTAHAVEIFALILINCQKL